MLTNNEIKKQMHLGNIVINNLRPNALNKPNSCDISIGNILYSYDYAELDSRNGILLLNEVMNDKPAILRKHQINEEGFLLEPHKVYLAKTVEEIETHNFVPVMTGKVSMSLLGVSVELNNNYKKSNYKGNLLLTIVATKPTIIYPDIPIGNLYFFPSLDISKDTNLINNSINYGTYQEGMLSGDEIKKRMKGNNPDIYIDNTDKIVINPNSVNLTLNKEIGIYSDPILNIKKENNIEKVIIEDGMWLSPDEVYLGRTNEWTETHNLVPMMSGRSSLGRNGLHVHCSAGMGSVGYKGYWHLGIRPVKPIWIVKDLKCCQICYYTLEGELTELYNGNMQELPTEKIGSKMHKILSKTY